MTPKKVFFIMLGVLVVSFLIGVGAFYFADQNLTKSSEEIQQLKAENDVLDLRIASMNAAKSRYDKLEDIHDSVSDILPPEKIQSDIVAQLLSLSKENNISLNNISFPSSADPANFDISQTEPLPGLGGVRFLAISTDFETNFAGLLSFLGDIDSNRRIMQVESISINPGPNNSLSVNMVIQVYVKG